MLYMCIYIHMYIYIYTVFSRYIYICCGPPNPCYVFACFHLLPPYDIFPLSLWLVVPPNPRLSGGETPKTLAADKEMVPAFGALLKTSAEHPHAGALEKHMFFFMGF